MAYSKLHSTIVNSSLWNEEDATRILFITMLAMADQDGFVYGSKFGIARVANIDPDQIEDAFCSLSSPDTDSSDKMRAPENEGRRIEPISGGYRLLNYEYYRGLRNDDERREQNRLAQQRFRDRKQSKPRSATFSHAQPPSAQAEAEAEAEAYSGKGVIGLQHSTDDETEINTTPPDLHPFNYATKILKVLKLPHTKENIRTVAMAIEAEVRDGKSVVAAYDFVMAGSLDAKEQGWEINRFFFQDAKYRQENRNGTRRPEPSKTQLRTARNREALIDALTAHTNAGPLRSNLQPGNSNGRSSLLVEGTGKVK